MCTQRRKKTSEIREEIARRQEQKLQKKKMAERKKLERRIKDCDLENLEAEFKEYGEDMRDGMRKI